MPRIYCVQFDIAWEDKPANHRQVQSLLEAARPEAGSLILLPELFDVGFSLNVETCSEQATGHASERFCADLARRLEIYVQGASIQRPAGHALATNNAVVFNPGGELICRYEKIHPFSAGREPEAYVGGEAIRTFDWQGVRVCPFICYDLRFPEIWRAAAVYRHAELFTIGANWPVPRHHHWLTLLEARAIENLAWVAAVNRVGDDPFLQYGGGSRIVSHAGEVVADAGDRTGVISAEIDIEAMRAWRDSFGALRDVREQFLAPVREGDSQ